MNPRSLLISGISAVSILSLSACSSSNDDDPADSGNEQNTATENPDTGGNPQSDRLVSEISELDGSETLRDKDTGLVWVNDVAFCFAGVTDPANAQCGTLSDMNVAGRTDWRLPDSSELAALTLAVDADDAVTLNYINASCAVMTASDGWVFTENSSSPGTISQVTPGNAGVRCVAGESGVAAQPADARLVTKIASSDETEVIEDTEAELTWVNDIRYCFAGVVDQASTSCAALNDASVAGVNDWRTPTSAELVGLTNAVVADDAVTLNYINSSCAVMTGSDGWVFTENSSSPGTISQVTPGNSGLRCVTSSNVQ